MTVSRQLKWQRNKIKQGLCRICGKRKLHTAYHCKTCAEKYRGNCNQWRPGSRGRIPIKMKKKHPPLIEVLLRMSVHALLLYRNGGTLCTTLYTLHKQNPKRKYKTFNDPDGKGHWVLRLK